ncbi:metalloenzyme superfamily, partial [Candidatus Poribacteria bacterium]|nr:metalloenzyme superfamily [Candidatus Poribacteria bacterium]
QPDAAGHSHTYSPESPGYLRQLSETDGHVGRIVGAVRNRPTYADEDWLVIVTTDHGGSERGHGKDIPEHRTVFVLLEGPSVQAGSLDGGVNIADVGVTALVHLGVPVEPSWEMDGRVVALTAS